MFDLDISKLAVIGVVALVVIGPEKLPRVARTVGALLGKAQRYVSDVKAEVNRSMELEELKKMKEEMEGAAKDVQSTVQTNMTDFEKDWQATTNSITQTITTNSDNSGSATSSYSDELLQVPPSYKHPQKKWRVKQSAMPQWFKARSGVRRQALSGAARVARYRPKLK
ncbi:MAG: Sec-independent protein translocase protein TatB [Cytophagales bacterium]|nr:Sec-independent protein translocase protein TatB [Cytophagales bacterium]